MLRCGKLVRFLLQLVGHAARARRNAQLVRNLREADAVFARAHLQRPHYAVGLDQAGQPQHVPRMMQHELRDLQLHRSIDRRIMVEPA